MTIKAFANELREAIQEVKDKGQTHIDPDVLLRFVTETEQTLDAIGDRPLTTAEREKMNYDRQLAEWNATFEERKIGYGTVIDAALGTIKMSSIINGGAAITILGFIANAGSSQPLVVDVGLIKYALLIFGVGVFSSCAGLAAMYCTQYAYFPAPESLTEALEKTR